MYLQFVNVYVVEYFEIHEYVHTNISCSTNSTLHVYTHTVRLHIFYLVVFIAADNVLIELHTLNIEYKLCESSYWSASSAVGNEPPIHTTCSQVSLPQDDSVRTEDSPASHPLCAVDVGNATTCFACFRLLYIMLNHFFYFVITSKHRWHWCDWYISTSQYLLITNLGPVSAWFRWCRSRKLQNQHWRSELFRGVE